MRTIQKFCIRASTKMTSDNENASQQKSCSIIMAISLRHEQFNQPKLFAHTLACQRGSSRLQYDQNMCVR